MRWLTDMMLNENAGRLRLAVRAHLSSCCRRWLRIFPFAKNDSSRGRQVTKGGDAIAGRAALESGNLSGRLAEEKDFLLSWVRGVEAEFLATGEGLMRSTQQMDGFQKECHTLTELTLGQSEDAAVQFAFQLLKKAEDLVLASYEQYDHVFVAFSELHQRITQLSTQQDGLMRVLLPLNFITMAIRMEASRHPLAVRQAFFTLADDVNRTVNEVRSTMDRQFDELAASERMARRLMDQISISIQKHREEVSVNLGTSRQQLHILSDSLSSSAAGATGLVQQNQAVARHINRIVMALQCEDIVRQQVQHVGEAMDEMCAHVAGLAPAADADAHHFVLHVGQVQLRQVQNVFEQLNHAAAELKAGIHDLRTEAGAAADVVVKMAGVSLDAKVAHQCQTSIGEILGIVTQAIQNITNIIAAFAPLQASFVDCTSKATALASDVRRAGLNAQVFAIHAPNGATLEVLAGRVRTISEDVIEQVGQMGGALTHTTEMVNNLRARLEDFQSVGQMEQAVLTEESARSQKKFAELEVAIPRLIESVTRQQETFAQSIEDVLAKVQFPETVTEASARSTGFFEDLVAWGGQGSKGGPADSATAMKLELLRSRYTMASERDIHAAAMHAGSMAAPAAVAASAPPEFFDEFEPATSPAGPAVQVESSIELFAAPAPSNAAVDPAPAVSAGTVSAPSAVPAALGDNVELF